MKYLLLLMVMLAAGCSNEDLNQTKSHPHKTPKQHEALLMQIVLFANGGQPAILESVTFFQVNNRRFAEVGYRITGSGQTGNLLIEGPSPLLMVPEVLYCMGGCNCYIVGTLDPQGNYQLKCTCTDCLMIVHPFPGAAVLFEP